MLTKIEALNKGYETKHLYNIIIPKKYELEKINYFLERNIKNAKYDYFETDEHYIFQQKEKIKNSKLITKKLTNDIIFIYQKY